MARYPVLIIHGGAGSRKLDPLRKEQIHLSLLSILEAVSPRLFKGGDALEAVTEAVRLLEDDPLYNAGLGSKIQSDGHIRMSASIMDGATRRFGGCVNVESVKNPILLARALMREKDRVLSGEGAARFAKKHKLKFASPFTERQRAEYRRRKAGKSGTVGAVALDCHGHLAAATSTGGRGFEHPFRVSDSPTVAGNFATSRAAVSATGVGEQIVEQGVAASLCALVEAGWPLKKAVRFVLASGRKTGGDFGLIAIDRRGQITAATNTPLLIWAAVTPKETCVLGRKLRT